MPLTGKGEEIKSAMEKQYGAKKGESVFYASKNKGTITGVDAPDPVPELSTSESPTANMGASEGLVGVEDAARHDRMFPNKHGAKDVGAVSWVGKKQTGYSIEDCRVHPSFTGDRSLCGNHDDTPVYPGLKKG